jgi:hypothetical protein
MGAWGPGVFSNDFAADVRGVWRDGVLDGVEPEALQARLVEEFGGLEDEVFWPALAAAQHETGRLTDDVRDRAVAVIDAGADVEDWEELAGQRARVLARLRAKLLGPPIAPKRLRRPRNYQTTFALGDVIALNDAHGVPRVLVAVAGFAQSCHEIPDPLVVPLVWSGHPAVEDLDVAATEVLFTGSTARGDARPVCIRVTAGRADETLMEAVGAVVGSGAHPYRLPVETEPLAESPLVESVIGWPYLAGEVYRAGVSAEHEEGLAELHDALGAVWARAAEIVRGVGLDAVLPAERPPAFDGTGETYPMLGALLARVPIVGGRRLLGLTEPQWNAVLERIGDDHVGELETLRAEQVQLIDQLHDLQAIVRRALGAGGWR